MMFSGLFTQIALFALSIGVIFTYIKPTFEEISTAQEQIGVYQKELSQVSAVNAMLRNKLQQVDAVPADDRNKLLTYMPDNVDPLDVMRDIEIISDLSGARLMDITDAGPIEDNADQLDPYLYGGDFPVSASANGPYAYSFIVNAEGTYNQIKQFIALMESNKYPLEIQKISMQSEEGGFLTTEITVHTYSQLPNDPEDVRFYEDVNVTYE